MKIYLYLWPLRKKVQFCPTMKKTLKIQCTFLPHCFFWYCSNLPHGLHHFFISVQPHSIGRATDFFFLLFEKSCFFHVIFWVIWVLKHILNNFFFYDFQKVTLFCCCPESSGVGLNTGDGRGALHEKWWGKYGLWKF